MVTTVLIKKKVGVWGFGRVGKSVAQLLSAEGYAVSVMTQHALTADETAWTQQHPITFCTEEDKDLFLHQNDYLIPSPGVDIRADYQADKNKWLPELDLFYTRFKKPIISVTGTVGKTTITFMLDQILQHYGLNMCTGGNIGNPMCDLIPQQHDAQYALLEVSSFQLEYCTVFAPQLALWTNLAPNHLDRHTTYEDYFNAKYQCIAHQKDTDKAIVPLCLALTIKNKAPKSSISYVSATVPTPEELSPLNNSDTLFFLQGNQIKKKTGDSIATLITLDELPNVTFAENWLIICSALDVLGLPLNQLPVYAHSLAIPEHRMEKIVSHDIVFYNDSKSTTTASTRAAVEKLQGKSIIVFIGGLSKGVDRAPFIKELKDKVQYVYCFGAEADALYAYCATNTIPAQAFATLDDAFDACVKKATTQDCVLFSPAGSSYDLFKDYEERGNYFKKLVHDLNK